MAAAQRVGQEHAGHQGGVGSLDFAGIECSANDAVVPFAGQGERGQIGRHRFGPHGADRVDPGERAFGLTGEVEVSSQKPQPCQGQAHRAAQEGDEQPICFVEPPHAPTIRCRKSSVEDPLRF